MISNSPIDESQTEPVDALDRLLLDYFKSQLRQPWPPAPRVPAAEPASLVADRLAVAEVSRPHGPALDSHARARYTLAASVVLLLGTCWYLSSGIRPANRSETMPTRGGVLNDAGASKPVAIEELKHDRATKGEKTPPRQPMQLP